MRTPFRPPARIALAATLLTFGGLGMLAMRMSASDERGVRFEPGTDVPRLAGEALYIPGLQDVSDFDLADGALVILDGRQRKVFIADPVSGSVRSAFGRRGTGPGELFMPTSVSVLPDGGIGVLDLPSLHRFDEDGTFQYSERIALPCRMAMGHLRTGGGTLYLSGNCAGGPGAADTVFASVFRRASSGVWELEAQEARMTVDGRWGSVYAALAPLGEGRTAHVFGLGYDDCVVVLPVGVDAGPAREMCGLAPAAFSVPNPDAETPKGRPGIAGSPAFQWPDPMPRWMVLAAVEEGPVMGRLIRGDSLLFQFGGTEDQGARDLLVTGGNFAACRHGVCAWADALPDGTCLTLVDFERLVEGTVNHATR